MKKSIPAASPDAYVAALSGWQRKIVEHLRSCVRTNTRLDEVIKWGNLVYMSNGPAIVVRAEEKRVLFGFWRGKRLREIEPRLHASGKYELATLALREGDSVTPKVVRQLVKEAVSLNQQLGNPTDAAKKG